MTDYSTTDTLETGNVLQEDEPPIIDTLPGRAMPLGSLVTPTSTRFSIFSRHATKVWLLLFNQRDDDTPTHRFELTATENRTGDIWHIELLGVGHGQLYLYQMDGPYEPNMGHRFNKHKPLLDPYTKATVGGSEWDFSNACGYDPLDEDGDISFSTVTDFKSMPKCVVYGDDGFDWQGDRPLNRPLNETIVYETHVRSLSCHPSAKSKHPGTFAGVIEKIPHFKKLGVTAIELLPIHLFNELELNRENPETGERLRNYWGYNTLAFFAPHESYSHHPEPGGAVLAFKEMVKALHKAGLELILDVVFNHTVEGNQMGPTVSFRGVDNSIYYILAKDPRYYMNPTGVGNTLNVNNPIVQDFVIDCLRYWVHEMHVDGFRFDLAASLCRDYDGQLLEAPPLIIRIAQDPFLRDAKIIAEPWDIDTYKVGEFPGGRWLEWNDKYRDEVRQFWRGDVGLTSILATRLAGSSDIYEHLGPPSRSVNFIAAHDGFTLNDVVSYDQKHNEANGEDNLDGHNHNRSYNYGHEGPTDDPDIEEIRTRQTKNMTATLLLSQGMPMLNGGDEFRRTQQGNNNAYCQHSDISWYDWTLREQHAELLRFNQRLIALRQAHPVLRRRAFFSDKDIWLTPAGTDADWQSYPKELMCLLNGSKENTGFDKDDVDILIMFNADVTPHLYYIPPPPQEKTRWHLALDTGLQSPNDIHAPGQEVELEEPSAYLLKERSLVVMLAKKPGETQWWLRSTPYKHLVPKPRHIIRKKQIRKHRRLRYIRRKKR
ncbi:glycogen debranching protein GlgX [Anaerolineales bacterium HSG25]|nr:glycogen debranching protein GlgX [Anaerolineales bacterium HSG25]